jgi:trimethylamine:corrinoid methyltransferase-like protein
MNWKPSLTPPLSTVDLETILTDALRVLEEIGISCQHKEISRRLAEWPGTSFAHGRVRFSARNVRAHIERKRASLPPAAPEDDGRFTLGGCWAGLNYCDPETQEVRHATSQEVVQMVRFWDARGISGVVPLQPGDVPPELVTLTAEHIGLTHSRAIGGSLTVTDPEEIRFLIDMNLAAGRRYHLMIQTGISPLRFNDEGLGAALPFLSNPDVNVALGGYIPTAGATCPLDPRAALVQSAAETLAHDILCTVLKTAGGGFGLRVEPFDFQYSTIVFGSAEWCLYYALVHRMTEFLSGRPCRHGRLRSVAKRPDAQAACERTASALWQALLGVRHFGGAGQLSVDEVFSPQQVIIDREILQHVERLLKGLDLDSGPRDPVDLIRQGVEEGHFIALEDTVTRFRGFYHFPDLFRHWNVGRWRAEGAPSILSEAWERVRQEMAKSTFALPQDRKQEVDRLFKKAARYVQNR